jgi:SAM-dependent methyltransferase
MATDAHRTDAPAEWVVRWAHLVPRRARVLDVASGGGRHARYFASRGCQVTAVDRDAAALGALSGAAGIDTLTTDLEAAPWPFAGASFDAVVVTNYLHRPLFPMLVDVLARDGVLLYETFMRGNEAHGKPSNPAFLLATGELLGAFGGELAVAGFEQGVTEWPRRAVVQRIAAVRTTRPDLLALPRVAPGMA